MRNLIPIKYVLLLISGSVLLFSSCGILKKQPSKPQVSTASPRQIENVRKDEARTSEIDKHTPDTYIERFSSIAIREMNSSGVPASITLAQGLLESGNGNSKLAREANNHFGIKCTSEWKGKTILKDDDQKDDCFRVYASPEESFEDHSEFLKRKRYAALFELDKNDYQGWAKGLKAAGYATNPRYAELLISLIERYKLNRFDSKETTIEKIKREDRVLTEIAANIPKEKLQEAIQSPVAMRIHEVKAGDTLSSVSKLFGISVDDIKVLNGLENPVLKPGQLLVVSK